MTQDDRQLVLECRKMNHDAYQELFRRYEGYVYRLCYDFSRNREDALDLTQETFIKVFTSLHSYKVNLPFKPWVRKVAVSQCMNFLNKRSPVPLFLDQPSAGDGQTLSETLASPDNPARVVECKEASKILEDAVHRLPAEYRLLIILRHHEEMSYQEIAETAEIPLGTVKTYLFRARAILRSEMSAYYAWEV